MLTVNRQVTNISPPARGSRPEVQAFADYLHFPNIVLLGDPGAGKSYLFEAAAKHESAKLLHARSFATYADGSLFDEVVYIDALDEKRSRSDTSDAIEAIIRCLVELTPKKVRISCRSLDWLGETDLSLFKPYFESSGGYAVLQLNDLTEAEQTEILLSEEQTDPAAFIQEASLRGVGPLMRNPQTLKMLVKVVGSKSWPETRFQLYEEATQILLREHNLAKVRRKDSNTTLKEITSAAGAASAALLISDAHGISLVGSSADSQFPSFDSVPHDNAEIVLIALNRRAFQFASDEVATYSHRTIAEFLGAKWLANQIQQGLPLARLMSVISIEGRPALELRGLHSWLPLFLPNYANELIRSDPIAVLTYGDPKSLSPDKRRVLLTALEALSEEDPWFRKRDGSSEVLGNLSGQDMIDGFRQILKSKSENYHLRSLVLEAIQHGAKLPELAGELFTLLENEDAAYIDRRGAFLAIINAVPDGADKVAKIARAKLSNSPNDSRICAEIIGKIYRDHFTPDNIIALISNFLSDGTKHAIGELWSLSEAILDNDVDEVLDRLAALFSTKPQTHWTNRSEVVHLFAELLLRQLGLTPKIEANRLWKWLKGLHEIRKDHEQSEIEELRKWLEGRSGLIHELFAIAWDEYDAQYGWLFWHDFRGIIFYTHDRQSLIPLLIKYSKHLGTSEPKRTLAFQFALNMTFQLDPPNVNLFEQLYAEADGDPLLTKALEANVSCEIESWQHQEAVRAVEYQSERDAGKKKRQEDFDKCEVTIRTGEHLGWLKWASYVYFEKFSDTDKSPNKHHRLVNELGPERAATAVEGLLHLVLNLENVPSVDEVIELRNRGKFMPWWHAVLAGMDIAWQENKNLAAFSDKVIEGVLAIELYFPIFEREGNSHQQARPGWIEEIYQKRTALAVTILKHCIENDLNNEQEHSDALNRLTVNKCFSNSISQISLELLKKYPNAKPYLLKVLLLAAAKDTSLENSLYAAVINSLMDTSELHSESASIWYATGFLLFPKEFLESVAEVVRATNSDDILWSVRSLISELERPNNKKGLSSLSTTQVVFLTEQFGSRFPNVGSPDDGWVGDRNAWDASQFVGNLVSELSTRTDDASIRALGSLVSIEVLSSYRNLIKHSLANQSSLRRQNLYKQPTWDETIRVLQNGRPVNASDLLNLAVEQLHSIERHIRNDNVDSYKLFWNVDKYGRVDAPKPEESARDALVVYLRPKLEPLEVRVEPEGHMVQDKRADIVLLPPPGLKLPVELKRDYHPDVWTACSSQLDRLYTRDPEAGGNGLYVVFWYGEKRKNAVPKPPENIHMPRTAKEMENSLASLIPVDHRSRLKVVVIDVSNPVI